MFFLLVVIVLLPAQERPRKPLRRAENLLNINSTLLKTIYTFIPSYYDTIPQPGPDPVMVAKYNEKDLIKPVFDAVFTDQVNVYNPNFWGTVPQLLDKKSHDKFDTLQILDYLAAGWDTSYMIENDGSMKEVPEYRKIPYDEVSGLFFYESWWLDSKTKRMYKDVIAYLPIREYTNTIYDGYEETQVRRRLLYMVLPDWSSGEKKKLKFKKVDFRLLRRNIRYETQFYNKSYEQYIYREEEYRQIMQAEFDEWQYHQFDFYRHFDPDMFLEKIITGILEGNIKAFHAGSSRDPLNREGFIKLLYDFPGEKIEWDEFKGDLKDSMTESDLMPENYPVSDLNSITFQEDWYINPENLQLYKEVKSITVNRTMSQFDNYTGDYIRGKVEPLFTVWFK